jgi:DNA polymerase IV
MESAYIVTLITAPSILFSAARGSRSGRGLTISCQSPKLGFVMGWHLHVDMDAFFASVEVVMDPSLRGKPVIVGGRGGRGVVTSASYEARKFGVHSAMPGFQARKLCPHGVFLPNRRQLYSDFSRRVFALLERYSPEVHAISIDEGVVNLTGTERLHGPPIVCAHEIILGIEKEIGLPASGGLSSSRVVAKVAATLAKPRGLIYVSAGSERAFLGPLRVESIPGVGPKTQEELSLRGIKTVAELWRQPRLALRYLDIGDKEPHGHDRSVGHETTLDRSLNDPTQMEGVLWELVEEVGERLRREGFRARCITLKIRYSDFRTITRSRTLSAPTCFDREIFAVAGELLRANLATGRHVRLLGVSASALLRSGWQDSMFEIEKRLSWEKLYQGIDQLRDKYGDEAIGVSKILPRPR